MFLTEIKRTAGSHSVKDIPDGNPGQVMLQSALAMAMAIACATQLPTALE